MSTTMSTIDQCNITALFGDLFRNLMKIRQHTIANAEFSLFAASIAICPCFSVSCLFRAVAGSQGLLGPTKAESLDESTCNQAASR